MDFYGRRTRRSRVGATVRHAFGFLAFLSERAAQGCRLIVEATLHWPPPPSLPNSADDHDVRWGLLHADHDRQRRYERARYADGRHAWPGLVVVVRLLYLALALCLLLGELSINIARVPAVLGLPGGGVGSSLTLSLGVTTALLFFAMACFLGAVALELWDVTPPNTHLFPALSPGIRRVFRTIAAAGFFLTVLTVGLLYAAGAILLETGQSVPELSILVNLVQGILLTIVAVPALWALGLGLLAIVTLVCALLWLVLTGLSLLCRFASGGSPGVLVGAPLGLEGVLGVPGAGIGAYDDEGPDESDGGGEEEDPLLSMHLTHHE